MKENQKTKQSLCNVPMFCTQKLGSFHHVPLGFVMVFNDIQSEFLKFLCVFQIVPNNTTLYPISLGQTSILVNCIGTKRKNRHSLIDGKVHTLGSVLVEGQPKRPITKQNKLACLITIHN
jgi:hypothetical protein